MIKNIETFKYVSWYYNSKTRGNKMMMLITILIFIIFFWYIMYNIEAYLSKRFNKGILADFNIYDVEDFKIKVKR